MWGKYADDEGIRMEEEVGGTKKIEIGVIKSGCIGRNRKKEIERMGWLEGFSS